MVKHVSDVPRGDDAALEAETAAVVAYLSAVTNEDDDPDTNADDVTVEVVDHPDDPSLVRIIGTIDAEPDAPYLRSHYDPLAGVDPTLYAAEVNKAVHDLEVSDGQA